MFYTKYDIEDLIDKGKLEIESTNAKKPFDKDKQIGSGSIDLRIGDVYRKFKQIAVIDNYDTADDTELFELAEGEDISINPNEIILINTLETVFLGNEVGAILTGRSSYSRLGLLVEVSQNFIQPGYTNPIPLQLVNLHNDKVIKLKRNSAVCQIVIIDASSPYTYAGVYSHTIVKPEPSKAGLDGGTNTTDDFDDDDDKTEIQRFEQFKKKFAAGNPKNEKNIDVEFAKYFSNYVSVPAIVKPTNDTRTTGREDLMTFASNELLNGTKTEIKILDLCCGYGVFPHHLLKASGDTTNRIKYFGLELQNDCIEYIELNLDGSKFKDFKVLLGNISNPITQFGNKKFDIAFLINSLHEIPPYLYPDIFENIFKCLESTGRLMIIDMAELQVNEEEAIAITWDVDELKKIFKSCGIECNVTFSKKVVTVTTSILHKPNHNIDKIKMLSTIKGILISKRRKKIKEFLHLELSGLKTLSDKKMWLLYSGLITRITIAIYKINDKTKRK